MSLLGTIKISCIQGSRLVDGSHLFVQFGLVGQIKNLPKHIRRFSKKVTQQSSMIKLVKKKYKNIFFSWMDNKKFKQIVKNMVWCLLRDNPNIMKSIGVGGWGKPTITL